MILFTLIIYLWYSNKSHTHLDYQMPNANTDVLYGQPIIANAYFEKVANDARHCHGDITALGQFQCFSSEKGVLSAHRNLLIFDGPSKGFSTHSTLWQCLCSVFANFVNEKHLRRCSIPMPYTTLQ